MEDTSASTTTSGAGAASPRSAAPGPVRRVFEWFWRGKALSRVRAERRQASPLSQELSQRSRLLFTLGERARHPSEPLPANADAAAAELYRQSAYFGARALAEARGGSAASPWDSIDGAPLRDACGGAEQAAELLRWVEGGAFPESWEASKEQRAVRAAEAARLCRFLLGELSWQTRARDALWLQRALRLGGTVALILGVLLGVRAVRDRAEREHDVAVGKAWRTSSSAGLGCSSPQQLCGTGTDFFFHTNEERNPWVEIDLGQPTPIAAIRVVNRKDCCFERAIPLVLEVGNDPEKLTQVGRRTTPFSSWRADFPKTTARYVRARATGKTILHLAEVRVLTE